MYFGAQRQQKQLSQSEKEYKSLFYSNPTPLWIYDQQTLEFIGVNDAAIHAYGYSRKEFTQMTAGDHRLSDEPLKGTSHSYHESTSRQHIKKNGETITVLITSYKFHFKGREAVMVMPVDITATILQEQKLQHAFQTEKDLREQLQENMHIISTSLEEKRKLAEVVARINNMVVITDPYGMIAWVNQAFENFTGYSLTEVIGRTPDFLHGPDTDPSTQAYLMESLQRNEFPVIEIINYTKSGHQYWVEISISPVYNENGVIEQYISIQNIITDRKARENKFARQNEALRKLAWTHSHALRKPVASILGLVELCQTTNHDEQIKELNAMIGICSRELDYVVKQISQEINTIERS
nr:PAS domain S-box protein [Pedobacter xinjiangensis]